MEGAGLILALVAGFFVLFLLVSAWAARELPDSGPVPTHFDIKGRPDGFGSRWITLSLMPVSYVLVNGLMLAFGFNAGEPVDMNELVTAQLILGATLLATHGFIMFLLLRWARAQ